MIYKLSRLIALAFATRFVAAEVVDCIRINPGNIGSKEKVAEVVKACQARNIPIRIGVNSGSLEKEFLNKYYDLLPML